MSLQYCYMVKQERGISPDLADKQNKAQIQTTKEDIFSLINHFPNQIFCC